MLKYFLLLVFSLCFSSIYSQFPNAKDRVVLKDSTEFIGYVFEQIPGRSIKLIRIIEKDTVIINMRDIVKYAKIFDLEENIVAEIKGEENVKEVNEKARKIKYTVFYSMLNLSENKSRIDVEYLLPELLRELGIGVSKNINQKINIGVSISFISDNQFFYRPNKINFKRVDVGTEFKYRLKVLSSSKIKTAILFGVSYIFDSSSYEPYFYEEPDLFYSWDEYFYENSIGVKLGVPLNFPFRNKETSFFIEPSIMYHKPRVYRTSINDPEVFTKNSFNSFKLKQLLIAFKVGIKI